MKGSQTAAIREVLEAHPDGITTAEIHRRTGTSRLNSRGAEIRKALRKEGRDLICEHIPGAGVGPEAYRWRIVGALAEPDKAGRGEHQPLKAPVKGLPPGSASAFRLPALQPNPHQDSAPERLFELPSRAYRE